MPRQARPLSEATIEEQTAALAAAIAPPLTGTVPLLVFRRGGERFAVPATSVHRIVPPLPVRRVPHRGSPAFRGLVAHEGEIIPAGSLERLLELPESDTVPRRMVLIGPAGRTWAFAVDAVDGVHEVPERELRPAPVTVSKARGGACRAVASVEGHQVSVLDASSLCRGWEEASA